MEKEIASALYLTYENAKSLWEEAQILKQNIKTSRAYTLFHLCFEECGRFHLIYNLHMSYVTNEISAKDLNYGYLKKKGYEKHNEKILESFRGIHKMAYVNLLINSGLEPDSDWDLKLKDEIQELETRISELYENDVELNRLKNQSLYVTFENNKFNLPDDIITVRHFAIIEKIATISLKAIKRMVDFADAKGGYLEFKRILEEEKE
ncbi:MAG: AbiV family abortive infection protein [Bacteroidetes bacterium]|nr:AbiV family abortive infection protein [Bacteroidota bacterium]NCQ10685.1 AbiV family abortive infection protein [Bacteroidota bacterium]